MTCNAMQTCSSKCCDAKTCRLKANATCASGACCDWDTCTLRPRGRVCRAADGPCDVQETCSGSGEWCPSDDKVADGVDCAAGQAFCYKGQCRSSTAQCQRLFSSAARSADSECFTRLNVISEYLFGHCHMRLTNLSISNTTTPTFSYLACASQDAECGLQQCYQDTRPSSANRVIIGNTTCYTLPKIDLSSSGLRSPSLVPDGAKCGTNSMCVNSTCTPLSTVRACTSCPDCGVNGVLTTGSVCFCNPGFAPPNCSTVGCGGSVTSPLTCSGPVGTTATPTRAWTTTTTGSTHH
uniref:Disintegrin domain-containing protein n=1 Tax=Macrostomum lignano TaxID=282301 RepID=A0A1I8J2L6_9PLAT